MSQYTVYVTPSAWQEMKNLPGHMRQRVKRTVDELAEDPRPSHSITLDTTDTELSAIAVEPRRLRMGRGASFMRLTKSRKALT